MALILEAVSVTGVVQRVPVAKQVKVTAQQGFSYRLVDDADTPFSEKIGLKRVRNSLVVDGLPQEQVVELDGFFFNCVPSAPCSFDTSNIGGTAAVTPASEPIGALQDGSFLMFGKGDVAPVVAVAAAESEFSARPVIIGLGVLGLVGLAAGGKGGGSSSNSGGGGGNTTAPPDAPVLTSAAATKETKPKLTGTAERDSQVRVGIDIDGDNKPEYSYLTQADANGNWTIDLATATPVSAALGIPASGLAEGTVTVIMQATNAVGTSPVASSSKLLIDKTPPSQTATIDRLNDDQTGGVFGEVARGGVSNDKTPTLSGAVSTALADGDKVEILRNGVAAGTASVSGTLWTFVDTLPDGTSSPVSYTARVVDLAGNAATASTAYAVTIDTVAPARPTIASVAGDNIVNAAEAAAGVVLSGTGEAGSLLAIRWGNKTFNTTVAAGSGAGPGTWQLTVAAADVPGNGNQPVTVTASDAAGNSAAATTQAVSVITGLPSAPTVNTIAGDNRINAIEALSPITVTGTADAGSTVTLNWTGLPNSRIDTTTAAANGTWSVIYNAGVGQSTGLLTVTARDAAGNTRSAVPPTTIVVDTVAPAQAISIVSATDDQLPITGTIAAGGTTNDQTPTINVSVPGGLASGETVHLYRNGVDLTPSGVSFAGTSASIADSSGTLASNTAYAYTARVIDAAGNQGALSAAFSLNIDFTAPATPTIAAVTGDDSITSAERAAGVTITGTAEAGSSVAVTWGTTTLAGTATGGNYSVTFATGQVPPIGTSTVSVTATDAVGNASTPASRSVTLLAAPVSQTVVISSITDDFAPGIGTIALGGSTNDGTPTLAGTLSSALTTGQTIHVFRNAVDITPAGVTAASTSWTFTDNTDSFVSGTTYSYTARVQDSTTTGSFSAAYTMVFDTTAPATPVIGVVAGNDIVDATEKAAGVAVTGSAETGSTVSVTWGTTTVTGVASAGAYSITFSAAQIPVDGTYTVTATATDAAGNVSTVASHAGVQVSTAPPPFVYPGTAAADSVSFTATDNSNLANAGSSLNGGAGIDTLVFSGSGISLNLTTFANASESSIERFNLTGSGANTLTLNTADVLSLGGQNSFTGASWGGVLASNQFQVVVDGNAGDALVASGGWTADVTHGTNLTAVSNGGHSYVVYNGTSGLTAVQLLIDTTMNRSLV